MRKENRKKKLADLITSKPALEDRCKLAIDTNHVSYSFIKNTIAAVSVEIGNACFNTKLMKNAMKKLDRINELVDELTELKLGCMAALLDPLYHSKSFDDLHARSLLEQLIGPKY